MSVEVQPYFAEGERYPALIGVRAEDDEYEMAYVSKSELVDALAENAKLRGERDMYHYLVSCMVHSNISDYCSEIVKLQNEIERLRSVVSDDADNAHEIVAENVKMLRLLRALALCADDNADCDKCVMNGPCIPRCTRRSVTGWLKSCWPWGSKWM